jgi:hypothetical protein
MNALNILSGGAAQGLVASLAPKFKAQTGLDMPGEFGAVGAMADKLRQVMPADIVILTSAIITNWRRRIGWSPPRYPTSVWSRPRSPCGPAILGRGQ